MNEKEYDRLIDDLTSPSDFNGRFEGGGESGALLDQRGSKYGSNSM
jgi:hypothetical protein